MANEKRFSFIIHPSFQYKHSLFIIAVVLFLGLLYLISIWDLFDTFLPYFPNENKEKLLGIRNDLILTLSVVQLAYTGIIFGISLFITHRIAGPMYKLKIYLQNLRSGSHYFPLKFRAKDHFHDVADEVSTTIEYFLDRDEEEVDYLSEVAAYIENISLVVPEDKKPVLHEIQKKLNNLNNL